MPRKKVELIEQPINLAPDVKVIIVAPSNKWPHIEWNGGVVTVKTAEAAALRVPVGVGASVGSIAPTTNGPDHDTAEIIQLKERVLEKKPYSSRDLLKEMGLDDGLGDVLEQNLTAVSGEGFLV